MAYLLGLALYGTIIIIKKRIIIMKIIEFAQKILLSMFDFCHTFRNNHFFVENIMHGFKSKYLSLASYSETFKYIIYFP